MADKVVQLVDKNSNNLYPVAGAAITDAISTGAISSQAVTSAKIANGNVTGVANNATVVGNTQLALDTVGTPNLRNQSVTSDKIDWATMTNFYNSSPNPGNTTSRLVANANQVPQVSPAHGPSSYGTTVAPLIINGVTYPVVAQPQSIRITATYTANDGMSTGAGKPNVFMEMGVITFAGAHPTLVGKVVYRFRHAGNSSGNDGENWITLN